MSWRIVVISKRAKLDLKMNYLVARTSEGIQRIFIDEVHTLIIESTAVSLTTALLAKLVEEKVKVIFCDPKRNPSSELMPYYGAHDTSLKCFQQQTWKEDIKEEVWTAIIREKIQKQAKVLRERELEGQAQLLESYLQEMVPGDKTNREGHAAKVYFNALFGLDFSRSDDIPINAALNYGYSILLSAFNREIVAQGYLTQFGIFHANRFNPFNLTSDFMEPIRPFVDRRVSDIEVKEFDKEEKYALVDLLNSEVICDHKRMTLAQGIKRYTYSLFDALNDGDISLIRHCSYEL